MGIYERLTRFDYVLAHVFKTLLNGQKGPVLPEFMEVDKYNEAIEKTLQIARDGCLDLIYERIIKGEI